MFFNFALLCLVCSIEITYASLDELYTWKYIDYAWGNNEQKSKAIDSGAYNFSKNIPYDVDRAPDGRIFVTIVKDVGVPSTLNTVSDRIGEGGHLLKPYPDWSWHGKNDCNGITGVYRVAISCNHLWVLDCGKIGEKQVCPAQLLLFDLSNDKLVKRITIPKKYATNANGTGLLTTPVVNIPETGCRDIHLTQVYMADTEGNGMVIWNGKDLYRIESKYFLPEDNAIRFRIAGETFDLADGLLGMAIEHGQTNLRKRRLYFRPLASFHMYYAKIIDLNVLKYDQSRINYRTEPNELRSQSAAQAFSKNGILFYSSSSDQSIICWNRKKPFDTDNNVQFAIDKETLQFASGVKVVNIRGKAEYLYVMTNRYQQVFNGVINFTNVNFRISTGIVDELVKGTNCE